MKKISVYIMMLLTPISAIAELSVQQQHELMLYPTTRVNNSGSGTVIHSTETNGTYVLTNYHVIDDLIKYVEEYDPKAQKKATVERLETAYIEFFEYHDLSKEVATRKVAADIIAHWKQGDLALLKLVPTGTIEHVAKLLPQHQSYHIFDETVAIGCSLRYSPLPTTGIVTNKSIRIDSMDYDMSQSQIIYGNSGGGLYLRDTGEFIGVPSRVAIIPWTDIPITHMGLFVPIRTIYGWFGKLEMDFLVEQIHSPETPPWY